MDRIYKTVLMTRKTTPMFNTSEWRPALAISTSDGNAGLFGDAKVVIGESFIH
jgi:hypothetical protein